jgi:hypothetical protein
MASGNVPDPEINKVSFDDKQERKAGDTSHAAGLESGKVPDPEINKVRLDDKEGKKVDQESSDKGPLKKVCGLPWKSWCCLHYIKIDVHTDFAHLYCRRLMSWIPLPMLEGLLQDLAF